MKISVTIDSPPKRGSFSVLKVKSDGHENFVRLDFSPLFDFAKDTSSPAFDFLVTATFIYSIDKIIKRELFSVDGWSREMEVVFPVSEPGLWNNTKEQFSNCLSFLTGDNWTIGFEKRTVSIPFRPKKRRRRILRYNRDDYRAVSLFSGGLDSLVGVIDNLEENKNQSSKILLASHYDGGSGVKSDQKRLLEILRPAYPNAFHHVCCGAGVSDNADSAREPSSRSRSIMFIGIGLYLANSISNTTPLLIPENGTISLNFPLSVSRRSSCSTRTTHPYFLKSLQEVLSIVDIQNPMINSYQFKTKGELVAECKNQPLLKKSALKSASCGKRGHKRSWDNKTGVYNCGKCMPCIYRRAALHKINLDKETYGIDIFNSESFHLNSNAQSTSDINACLSFLRKNYSHSEIGLQLLINGKLDSSKLEDYINLVLRTKQELKNWISDNNNPIYKRKAGIV